MKLYSKNVGSSEFASISNSEFKFYFIYDFKLCIMVNLFQLKPFLKTLKLSKTTFVKIDKKINGSECADHRIINLIVHALKIMLRILG